ncbi:hypothetical protein HRbin07_00310 [bacterium HR07]|nr:hypothetical protein HRbin07_00310 [bacterium HR07]
MLQAHVLHQGRRGLEELQRPGGAGCCSKLHYRFYRAVDEEKPSGRNGAQLGVVHDDEIIALWSELLGRWECGDLSFGKDIQGAL